MTLLLPPDRVLFRLTPATNRARRRWTSRPITARGMAALDLRGAAIVAVASDALLRVSEVSALDVADVNLEEQTVSIRRGRTDREEGDVAQFLGEPTVERIRAWLAGSGLTEGACSGPSTRGAGCGVSACRTGADRGARDDSRRSGFGKTPVCGMGGGFVRGEDTMLTALTEPSPPLRDGRHSGACRWQPGG